MPVVSTFITMENSLGSKIPQVIALRKGLDVNLQHAKWKDDSKEPGGAG